MTRPASTIALCAALPLPDAAEPPAQIHILPAGEIRTVDGRGPYRVRDAADLISRSMAGGARLPLDENHATDLAAPKGEPAPARGWITALHARDDGIWADVDWTGSGRALIADRAYRHISPAIRSDAAGNVTEVLRASLVNLPNLKGLVALHQEHSMDFVAKMRKALGLADDAGEDAILAAAGTVVGQVTAHAATIASIGKAAGAADGADGAVVLGAVQTLADPAKRVPVDQVAQLQSQLTTLTQSVAREKAAAFVDGAIRDGRVGVKPLRDHYVSRHMADPVAVEKEIGALPSLHAPGAGRHPAPTTENSDPAKLGADARAYMDAQLALGRIVSATDAVLHIQGAAK